MKKILALAAATTIIATTAQAADTAIGQLEPYGDLGVLSYSANNGGDRQNMWFGDFGVRLSPQTTSGPLKYSFYVGYDGLGAIGKDSAFEIGYATAAVVLETGPHSVSFGVPRTIMHDVFNDKDVIGSKLYGTEARAFSDVTRLARMEIGWNGEDGAPLYGLRYDGDFSQTTLSLGVFSGEVYDEKIQSIQVAMQHDIGKIRLRAGIERFYFSALYSDPQEGDDTLNNFLLGATANLEKISVGLDLRVIRSLNTSMDTAEIFCNYKINEQFRVGASLLALDPEYNSEQFSTLGVEYAQSNGTYARLSGLFGLGGSGNDAYELAVGLRF